MQNHKEPNGRAFIVGERLALKNLGETLIKASKSMIGLENIELYTSDGHKYEIVVVCDVSEQEWQNMPVPYDRQHDLSKVETVRNYDELKKEMNPV